MNSPIADQIRSLIIQGEGLKVEFKREAKENVCKEVAAMATTAGGHILIGVDDDGTVVGVDDDPSRVRSRIEGWIKAHVTPTPVVDTQIVDLDGRTVIAIYVMKGFAVAYHDHNRPTHRVGSSSFPMTPAELAERHQGQGVAAGIIGQGQLATMNLEDLKRLLSPGYPV